MCTILSASPLYDACTNIKLNVVPRVSQTPEQETEPPIFDLLYSGSSISKDDSDKLNFICFFTTKGFAKHNKSKSFTGLSVHLYEQMRIYKYKYEKNKLVPFQEWRKLIPTSLILHTQSPEMICEQSKIQIRILFYKT